MSEIRNRGLASADQETRERVARKGGQAVSQDSAHMAEIGSRGGSNVAPEDRSFSRDSQLAAEAGRRGGVSSQNSQISQRQNSQDGRGNQVVAEERRKGGQHSQRKSA